MSILRIAQGMQGVAGESPDRRVKIAGDLPLAPKLASGAEAGKGPTSDEASLPPPARPPVRDIPIPAWEPDDLGSRTEPVPQDGIEDVQVAVGDRPGGLALRARAAGRCWPTPPAPGGPAGPPRRDARCRFDGPGRKGRPMS